MSTGPVHRLHVGVMVPPYSEGSGPRCNAAAEKSELFEPSVDRRCVVGSIVERKQRTLAPDTIIDRSFGLLRVDFAPKHRQPSTARVVLATIISLVLSLAVDAALVAIGEAAFPSTKGYGHFRFSDYSKLTIIGVIIACVAWPIVTRISSAPRWLFFRLAIVVTLVLLLPDFYILKQGQPARAVAVLMCMHLAIAVVTYNALVHVARVRRGRTELGRIILRCESSIAKLSSSQDISGVPSRSPGGRTPRLKAPCCPLAMHRKVVLSCDAWQMQTLDGVSFSEVCSISASLPSSAKGQRTGTK